MKSLSLMVLLALSSIFAGALCAQANSLSWEMLSFPNDGTISYADNGDIINNEDNVICYLRLWNNTGAGTIRVTIFDYAGIGTATNTDLSTIFVYRDNNANGTVESTDQILNTIYWASYGIGWWSFNVPVGDASSGGIRLIFAAYVENHADGGTVSLQFTTSSWYYTDPNSVSQSSSVEGSGNNSATSPTMDVIPVYANLTLQAFTPNFLPAGNVTAGSINEPVCEVLLTQDDEGLGPAVTGLRVAADSAANTVSSTDIVQMKLYKEGATPDGKLDATDTLLATGTPTGSGASFACQFTWSTPDTVPASAGRTYLIVADIAGAATPGHKFRLAVQKSDLTFVKAPTWVGGVSKFVEDDRTIAVPRAQGLFITTGTIPGQTAGAVLPTIRVEARFNSAVDTTFVNAVTVEIKSGPSGGDFSAGSTVTVQAILGVATFSNLVLTKAGIYTLHVKSVPVPQGNPESDTNGFRVNPKPANHVGITLQPVDSVAGSVMSPGPQAAALDQYDNIDPNFTGTISIYLANNPGGSVLTGHQVTAVLGVADFPALVVNKIGTNYTMRFSATGLADSAVSSPFSVLPGPLAQLVILTPPASTYGGTAFAPSPRVELLDAGGNAVINYAGQVQVDIGNNPGGGALSGPTLVSQTNGIVSFDNLSIDKVGTGYTLVFSANGLNVTSPAFNIFLGQPAKLAITTQPLDTTGGLALGALPVVQVQDLGGNLCVGDFNSRVQVAITDGTGDAAATLDGTLTLKVVGGVATFDDLTIDKASATPYTLTFSPVAPANYTPVISNPFVVGVGPAVKLGFSVQPGMATFQQVFVNQPTVQIQDRGGNLVSTGSAFVALTIKTGSGATGAALQGPASKATTGGEAAFTGLSIDLAGPDYILEANATGLETGESASFSVATLATHISVLTEPEQGVIGTAFFTAPVVELRDDNEAVFSADNFTKVTATIDPSSGTPGAALLGSTQVTVVNGVATFGNLFMSTPGKGFRIVFTCYPALTSATSAAFDMAGPAVRLKLVQQPQGAQSGALLASQPVLQIVDANDVLVRNDVYTQVSVFITPATGSKHAVINGTTTLTAVNGLVSFADLSIDRPGTEYSLTFAATPSLITATSATFNVLGVTPPSENSSEDIVGGSAANSCSAAAGHGPWLLAVALLGLLSLCSLRRRKQQQGINAD